MARSNKPQPNEITIISLWYGLRNSIKILLMLALLAGIITYMILSLMQPRYSSEARLTIRAKPDSTAPDGIIENLLADIQSDCLLLKVAADLKLAEKEEFGVGQNFQLLNAIRSHLTVYKVADAGASDIKIRFSAADKYLAAQFVNALAQTYEQRIDRLRLQKTQQSWQESQLEINRLTKELQEEEGILDSLRAEMKALSLPSQTERLVALRAELKSAEDERAAARTIWQVAKEAIADELEALPEIQNSPIVQRLLKQKAFAERQLAEAKTLLPTNHPQIEEIASDLKKARASLRTEVDKAVRGLENKFLAANDRVKKLRREISAVNPQAPEISNEVKLKALETSVRSKRDALERLKQQCDGDKAFFADGMAPIAVHMASRGRPGSEPDFFQILPYILLASIAVFVLGLTFVTAREIMMPGNANAFAPSAASAARAPEREPDLKESKESTGKPAEKQQKKQIAAPAPAENIPSAKLNLEVRQADLSDLTDLSDNADEIVRSVAGRILRKSQNIPCYGTMIVGEDRTIEVAREGLMLAHALAQSGKRIALLDWHMRGESIAERLGFDVKNTVLDLLEGKVGNFKDIITDVPNMNVRYIAAGDNLELEYENLAADGLNSLFEALDEFHDHIVVVGRFEPMQVLFEACQNYFHAGIVVSDAMEKSAAIEYDRDTFLEFDVADIEIVQIGRR